MKKLLIFLTTFIFISVAYAQLQTKLFKWDYNGQVPATGFKLYKGPTPDAATMVMIEDVADGDARSLQQLVDLGAGQCYGISAYNIYGESPITTKTTSGKNVCVGKPSAPTGFVLTQAP